MIAPDENADSDYTPRSDGGRGYGGSGGGSNRKKPGIADLPLPPMLTDDRSPEDMDTDDADNGVEQQPEIELPSADGRMRCVR